MDAFGIHRRLIDDYSSYTRSFVELRDERVRRTVDDAVQDGLLWPDPWLQLNPSFEQGATADELVAEGLLDPECAKIFRIKKDRGDFGGPLRFHRHQDQAIRRARAGRNYVLTTGTGSGKSLAYIVPIVDHVLRQRKAGAGKGVKAIIVYPMNALANSQFGELEKFIQFGYPHGAEPLRYARYTGQENDAQREAILADPPDIVLTNYVMLELILTRRGERERLIRAARGSLQFLVLDELHTYRGRQGADVAMLVRRVRDACDALDLQVVGTSATMASGGSEAQNVVAVAQVASRLFGAQVTPDDVIGETLARATPELDLGDPETIRRLRDRLEQATAPESLDALLLDPLSSWIESAFGLSRPEDSDRLVRRLPRRLGGQDGAAAELAELTGLDQARCHAAVEAQLLSAYDLVPEDERPPFAFRLHQFLSKGDTVHATLEEPSERFLTLEAQTYEPGDRGRPLLPLAFCRECGQDVYVVWRSTDGHFTPRDIGELAGVTDDDGGTEQPGFLVIDAGREWPAGGHDSRAVMDRVPDSWIVDDGTARRIDRNRRKDLPARILVNPAAMLAPGDGQAATWIKAPFRFCTTCGVSYEATIRSDHTKLSGLSSGGRSTATTVLSLSAVNNLRAADDLPPKARKLLSFSDNRQDAALQAGHFNDFVEVALLRGALFRAIAAAGPGGIESDELVGRVFGALDLPLTEYAADPEVKFNARSETDRAFQSVLGYRLFLDLKRGWRVTMPNLEQSGLLHISYSSLDELAAADDEWSGTHAALVSASPQTRARICQVLADDLRRNLCMHVQHLEPDVIEQMRNRAFGRLSDRWVYDSADKLEGASIALPRPSRRSDRRDDFHHLSGRGGVGRWLRKGTTFPEWDGQRLSVDDAQLLITQLLEMLRVAGIVQIAAEGKGEGQVDGYQLIGSAMRWHTGDGTTSFHDVLRSPDLPEGGSRTNPYFVDFYRDEAATLTGLEAREHTAQVQNELRLKREDAFREAELPVLYCSPTMELGVDIAELNAVHLRNVPPTPANYAQRSGRAGRSGQPAIVTTYCAPLSPHDSYFFRRSDAMVSGVVAPPRLDLANADLVRAHVHAIWLAEAGISLGRSMQEVVNLDVETLDLVPDLDAAVRDKAVLRHTSAHGQRLMESIADDLADALWFDDTWLDRTVKQIPDALNRACDRWRELYRTARNQAAVQHAVAMSPNTATHDKRRARRLRAEAESQIELLLNEGTREHSDFYPYRYLAAEGFLPGYSFPRLPLAAFVPGQRNRDEYLQRPRFLAISEFGPGALIYHEGSRYQIDKVVIPAGEVDDDGRLPLGSMKQCDSCGYLHPYDGLAGADVCERCHTPLGAPLRNLFRMHNVVTRRRERINSDEEERQRRGYELRTGVRFAHHADRPASISADAVDADGLPRVELTYGDAATITRINLGWSRRKNPAELGYVIDLEEGRWLGASALEADDEKLPDSTQKNRAQRVVPYVEDTRNCLIVEPIGIPDAAILASLSAALKKGIQAAFQLEDSELAAEPLPTEQDRNSILLFEASEGGAGVLRRLVKEPGALAAAARAALDVCHFDADGTDQAEGVGVAPPCEAACYHCLLSYGNQRDHGLLDRDLLGPLLAALATGTVTSSSPTGQAVVPTPDPAGDTSQVDQASVTTQPVSEEDAWAPLYRQYDSGLERQFLDLLRDAGGRPPTAAQQLIEYASTRPDFTYGPDYTIVYVDGPHHDEPDQAERDAQIDEMLMDQGWDVVRFRYDRVDEWLSLMASRPTVFGVAP